MEPMLRPTLQGLRFANTQSVGELSYRCMRCPKTATTPNAFDTMSQSMLPPGGLLCALNARVWSAVLRCSLGHHGEATPDLESAPRHLRMLSQQLTRSSVFTPIAFEYTQTNTYFRMHAHTHTAFPCTPTHTPIHTHSNTRACTHACKRTRTQARTQPIPIRPSALAGRRRAAAASPACRVCQCITGGPTRQAATRRRGRLSATRGLHSHAQQAGPPRWPSTRPHRGPWPECAAT